MSIPSPRYYNSEGISVSWILHQLTHLLIPSDWLFLYLAALGFIRLSLLIDKVLLVYLTIQSTAPPVIILRWVIFIGLNFPLVIAKYRLLFPGDYLNSVPKHIETV